MLKWLSGEEGESGPAGPGSPRSAAEPPEVPVEEMAERLGQTEQLVAQLKDMIREKDAALRSKDDQLKVEKEACEAKLSKLRLQNKAKVTSLTSQLEELKRRQGEPGTLTHSKKGSSEGGGEQASRGKIVLLKKKLEELEQQLALKDGELENKRKELELQRQRGEEMDAMLTEKDKRLAEKEAYIIHLQTGLAGDPPITAAPPQPLEVGGEMQELQRLVQSLTRKVEEAEERYSLLLEQTDSLKGLLASEKEQYSQKESMYQQNIQTFKDIIIQKDNQLMEVNQMHEQELFRLAAKSDASADLEQLLKALKQKLHEKEEVLLGKTQVIDVLQGEVDGRDQQIKELTERLHRLQVERESLGSKMEAEKHVMRAQLRDLMEKHQAEVQRLSEQHQSQMDRVQQDLLGQLEALRNAPPAAAPPSPPRVSEEAPGVGNPASVQRMAELEAQAKQKTEEASRSEAKFLKIKAWSKSRIRQLEEELKKSQAGGAPPDLVALRGRITALEEEREENQWKLEHYEELRAKSEMLEAKLVLYEEQQTTLQAELEQFTKRAASQASESGSADETQSQVLEWQEMVAEAVSARDRAREEKAAMSLRISHMEEEREELIEDDWFFPGCSDPALATRQQELEEELAQARGLGRHGAKKLAAPAHRSLQEDFEFDGQASFQDPRSPSDSTAPMEGENMGGWWPEYSTPDPDGLRSVVEELELERNQLQEQILSLEERCQDLEDRLQLQARIEALQVTFDVGEEERPCWFSQNETERLQNQLASVRSQQSRDAEKHQLLVNSLNEQLKGLTDTQESLESSLIEKETTLAKTSEKLELIDSLRETLSQQEVQVKELSDKLLQTEHSLEDVTRRCSSAEKQCSELKSEAADLLQKQSVLKEKAQKQEVTIERLQAELDQSSEELDKLNSAHLEERAQLIHDLQSCEREIDSLKDVLLEKDREMASLAGNMAEYAEQVGALKQEVKLKEESLIQVEEALRKAEREAAVIRDSQSSDQQTLNGKITELVGALRDAETELQRTKEEREAKAGEVEHLLKQAEGDKKTMQELRGEIQKHAASQRNHLSECETLISSLKDQLTRSAQKLQESEAKVLQLQDESKSSEKLRQELKDQGEEHETQLKSFKEEQNKLLAQVQGLARKLEEQTQSEAQIKQGMQEKLEAIRSLEDQVQTADRRVRDERQTFASEKERLSKELKNQSESVSKLEQLLKSTETQKRELEVRLEGLELQERQLDELRERLASALQLDGSLEEQVQLLQEQRDGLLQQVTEQTRSVSEVAAQRDALQAKVSALETQLSESSSVIQGLQREKEDLNQVMEQSTHSSSELLLAKTNECSRLLQTLREREEEVEERQRAAADLQAKLEETLSLLRQQESSLKSAVTERDTLLQQKEEEGCKLRRDIQIQREDESRLRAEAQSLEEELSELRRQLSGQRETCRTHKDELEERNQAVKALQDQISVCGENARRLESEAETRKAELDRLNSRLQALGEEKQELRVACESKEKELSELTEQLKGSAELNAELRSQVAGLTEENRRLQEELGENVRRVSELTAERNSLQEKASSLERQVSERQRTIGALTEENQELKKVLEQSERSISAGLLEKTDQCARLAKTLQEKEEQLRSLQETTSEQRAQLEARQNQLLPLQDTVAMLQEQGSVLKSALVEKDSALTQKAEECAVHQEELLKLREEAESLRRETSEVRQQLEQRERAAQELSADSLAQRDELQRRSAQLGAANESAARMEAEIRSLKASVQKASAEATDLRDGVRALGEQNARLQSELQDTASELTASRQLVGSLRAELSEVRSAAREKQENLEAAAQQLKQSRDHNVALQQRLSELEETASRLRSQVENLTSENEEHQSRSAAAAQDLGSRLQAKQAECKSLKERVSHLEESVSKLSSSAQVQASEAERLRTALEEKEAALLERAKAAEEAQRRADEASLFRAQFAESAETASQLQSRVQVLSAESEVLRRSAEETRSAFDNLQEKYAGNLEELQAVRKLLSERTEEAAHLRASSQEQEAARSAADALRKEALVMRERLDRSEALNSSLSREKDEALASRQASVTQLTVEIQRLKSQHVQVAEQMSALSENLEQREMALHAINNQCGAQAKQAAQLLSQIQSLEEALRLSQEELRRLQGEAGGVRAEKEALEQSRRQELQEMTAEKRSLQAEVSARDEELCGLKENVQKVEQILQDSEKEWLSLLDREKQDKRLLAEQLEGVRAEMKAKDVKVSALKEDLDGLQERLAEAAAAVLQGSHQLSAKESEASASRLQLEGVLASIQEKEDENRSLQRSLAAVGDELRKIVARNDTERDPLDGSAAVNEAKSSLQDLIKQVQESHQAEIDALKRELAEGSARLQSQRSNEEKEQDSVAGLEARLHAEVQRSTWLQAELRARDEQLSCVSLQVSQQKELLSSLSQQLKEKDASIAQLIQAASNERLKLVEENGSLSARLEDLERARQEEQRSRLQTENSERLRLAQEAEHLQKQLAAACKEKEAMKKKLQAALVVRKDLLRRIDEYERQKEEGENNKTDALQERLDEMKQTYEEKISVIEAKLLGHRAGSERAVEQLESEKQMLQDSLKEKEACLKEALQKVSEKNSEIEQLQSRAEDFDRDRNLLTQKLEELQEEIKSCKDQTREESSSAAADVQKELDQLRAEKATLQRKAQAALLARKETLKKAQEKEKKLSELTDQHQALLEQHRLQADELDRVRQTSVSQLDEESSLRRLVQEKETSLLALQTQLEALKSRCESLSAEVADRDRAFSLMEARAADLTAALQSDLQKAQAGRQENQALLDKTATLEARLEEEERANEEKLDLLTRERDAALERSRQLRAELDEAVALVSQKTFEYSTMQKTLTETEQEKDALAREAEEARLNLAEIQQQVGLLEREKGNVDRAEPPTAKPQNVDASSCRCAENYEATLKEKDDALSAYQGQLSEKDQLIASLELQVLQRVKTHEAAVEKMKTEAEGLQRAQEDNVKMNDLDNQAKLLTRKLQAALLSRKELMKENASLKEEAEELRARREATEAERSELKATASRLTRQNADLEGSASSAAKERDALAAEVERVLNDNRSLSAACGSLKLTIESITQQKQAFSCQLESLKDSQTEELSRWRSKHAELKQEYESLLQAYENVSSEMDKMRQLLEGARRERQEALRRIHEQESQREVLERRAQEAEEEKERIKERMLQVENLEAENQNLRTRLSELDGNQEEEEEVRQLEAQVSQLREKLAEIQAENVRLAGKLEAASRSLEEQERLESNENDMQAKLDEALGLNESLTAQIEAQKAELSAQLEVSSMLEKEKADLSGRLKAAQSDLEQELGRKEEAIQELRAVVDKHRQEAISLSEKVRILEDDKSLLQEELESTQETSDKVKNENEYLETVILKNSERIDELTETVKVLQSRGDQLAAQLAASGEAGERVRREKEQEQLKLVREFEEKLKTVQRGSEGSKNVKRELQELLKEKHQEINQLQQNCIRYQELILDLESSLKSSRSTCERLETELKKNSEKTSASEERSERLESELVGARKLLREAEEKTSSVESERDRLALQASRNNKQLEETKASRDAEETRRRSFMHDQLQRQLEELSGLREEESRRVDELLQQLDSKDLQIGALTRAAESSEAKLCALTSTPHGADASRLWDDSYQKSLRQKDAQLQEQGSATARLREELRGKDKELSELRVAKLRLERTLNEYSVAAAAHQRQMFIVGATNAELSESSELMAAQVEDLRGRVENLERERRDLSQRLADREEEVSRLQPRLQQVEALNADSAAQLQLLQTQRDKTQADLEKQLGISLQLRTLLQGKDAEISSLLSCKDGQMSGYLEQLQANHRSQVSVYEDRLTSARYQRDRLDKEVGALQAKLKSLEFQASRSVQEKQQMEARTESLKNSMVSLQSEHERLTSEYRELEAKSRLGSKDNEGASFGEGGASKGFKHEIRKLLHQMDDLNSENAMLRAQLVRYREDLNQVLSLKDNQVKVLLHKQQDVIKSLETQNAAAEKLLRDSQLELQEKREESRAVLMENAELKAKVSRLEAERETTDEGRVIASLQDAVAAKASDCNQLQQKLLSQRAAMDELRSRMQQLESETDRKLAEAEDKYNAELDAMEREVELMRTEREAADQRVVVLAKEFLDLEQQLAEERSHGKDVKAQNESLGGAMAALQNDRDQLIEDFKTLRNRYDEELRLSQAALNKVERSLQDASSELAGFAKERDVLLLKLKAVESREAHGELSRLLDELSKALSEKERELKRLALENGAYSRQMSAFSRSMASLQNDRDRLMDELACARGVAGSSQGSGPGRVLTPDTEKEKALEDENDGLVKNMKADELHPSAHSKVGNHHENTADLRSEAERNEPLPIKKETAVLAGQSGPQEAASRLEAEKMQLHRDLQRCVYEIQQRDQYLQQLNTKLQQAVEEKAAAAAQLRAVSQTLRDTQNRCHWLETQIQGQGSAHAEVAPGAPQERSNDSVVQAAEASRLRERLLEAELSLADERARREAAEEALRLAEDRAKSGGSGLSRDNQRDFSIEMDTEEEWEALSLNPNQPLITRKVKGGMVACRRWLRGRSLYFSRLLTSRARSRYLFLAYLLTIHVAVLMCLTGAW
ncbi:golgin subfamily B member 1 isoform X2 [Fundulus heteroclitus]|uniref:golgin subfamily B member 1 isoform X2 n=1 Tax=Fundulus heteroclitus TaxID=8078 RepID=UPI00165A2A86|nr:golgin subfamily B member 1 isoform X2 [Fundulus heteroclitus]